MSKATEANAAAEAASTVPEGWGDARELTHAGFWKPDIGDKIRGILVQIREGQGKYKGSVADIQQETGEIISVGMSAVLKSRLSRVMVGREIGILYLGKTESGKEGNEDFHDFRVFVFGDTDPDLPF